MHPLSAYRTVTRMSGYGMGLKNKESFFSIRHRVPFCDPEKKDPF